MKPLLIFVQILWGLSGSLVSAAPLKAEVLLEEKADVFLDPLNRKHKIYYSNSHQKFRLLLDEILLDLLSTPLGQNISQYILGCEAEALSQHVGLSLSGASLAAAECFARLNQNPQPSTFVLESAKYGAEAKLTIVPGSNSRQYVLLLTEDEKWNIDSWTDPLSNSTLFVIERNEHTDHLTREFLTQLLAHEMAIYFDTKAWVGSPESESIPELNHPRLSQSSDSQRLKTALNNPLISQILRSLRAFHIEREFIKELSAMNKVSPGLIQEYNAPLWNFLSPECRGTCSLDFLKTQSKELIPQSLPLLAFAPHYRNQKLYEYLNNRLIERQTNIPLVLSQFPNTYLNEVFRKDIFFNIFAPLVSEEHREIFEITSQVTSSYLLPSDLQVLRREFVFNAFGSSDFSLLSFLKKPLLGGKNIRFSGGPRPRIRTGARTHEN